MAIINRNYVVIRQSRYSAGWRFRKREGVPPPFIHHGKA
jgi:hypothetical protein